METTSCCICSQVHGEADGDLIASLLPDQPYARRVLLETDKFAVIPSLGPLVPGHSLLCPKAHAPSFASLDPLLHEELDRASDDLSAGLIRLYGGEIHTFEHGMSAASGRVLCTVAHAHLHVLPLPCDFRLDLDDAWTTFDGEHETLLALVGNDEYVLYSTPDGAAWVLPARDRIVTPQYMRRLVAAKLGRARDWNWRTSPNATAADRTWRQFTHT